MGDLLRFGIPLAAVLAFAVADLYTDTMLRKKYIERAYATALRQISDDHPWLRKGDRLTNAFPGEYLPADIRSVGCCVTYVVQRIGE